MKAAAKTPVKAAVTDRRVAGDKVGEAMQQHGDPTATHTASEARTREFHALYRDEFAFVWASARRLGVPPAAVEDAVQDVFITAFRRLEHLRFEVSARAWLYGVTRRVASRYHRGVFRMARRVAALSAVAEPPPEAPQEHVAQTQSIDRLLDQLAPRTRAAWEMAELLGMTGPEIASELGLPLNTVYSRVRLARQQLQSLLGDPHRLERWLDDTRRDDAPPARVAQRAWTVLLPALSKSSPAVGLAALASTRAALVVTLTLVGVVVIVRPDPAPATTPARAVAAGTPAPEHPAPTTSASPTTAPVVPARLADEQVRSSRARPRPEPAGDRLAQEVALLDRAHAALAAGDAATTLARLAEHTRQFADGALVDLREAARVQALCLMGDVAAAVEAAARLVETHPRSAVAQRHRDFVVCPRTTHR